MRLFIAIDLPDSVRAALAREQARLRDACAGSRDIRWTRPEGVHLTLKFLGEVASTRLPDVTSALDALGRFEPFEVDVGGFGFFPSARRPRVFWVGLEAPPALGELARRVEAAMEPLAFAREDRPFQPHLTFARFESQHPQPALDAALQKSGAGTFGRFTVTEFFLFESKIRPGGAEYSRIARFPGAGRSQGVSSMPSPPEGSSS
jgi:RNA 2',3'-cyclic 3'-phosphodiesterase